MPDIEDRVAALETRVDDLTVEVRHATDVSRTASTAHQKNVALINAIRETQAEHSRILAEHDRRFDTIDRRFDTIDGRMNAIDGKLGQLTLGMHAIESLLRRMVEAG
jgi:hypothetical protein